MSNAPSMSLQLGTLQAQVPPLLSRLSLASVVRALSCLALIIAAIAALMNWPSAPAATPDPGILGLHVPQTVVDQLSDAPQAVQAQPSATINGADPAFMALYDELFIFANGGFGIAISLMCLLMGAGLGVAKGNPVPALMGVAMSAFLRFGPSVMASVLGADLPNQPVLQGLSDRAQFQAAVKAGDIDKVDSILKSHATPAIEAYVVLQAKVAARKPVTDEMRQQLRDLGSMNNPGFEEDSHVMYGLDKAILGQPYSASAQAYSQQRNQAQHPMDPEQPHRFEVYLALAGIALVTAGAFTALISSLTARRNRVNLLMAQLTTQGVAS